MEHVLKLCKIPSYYIRGLIVSGYIDIPDWLLSDFSMSVIKFILKKTNHDWRRWSMKKNKVVQLLKFEYFNVLKRTPSSLEDHQMCNWSHNILSYGPFMKTVS